MMDNSITVLGIEIPSTDPIFLALGGLLYEVAAVILTRSSTHSTLRTWGLQLRERIGFKRGALAVARKLAVITYDA